MLDIEKFDPFKHQARVWLSKYENKLKTFPCFNGNEFHYLSQFLEGPCRKWYFAYKKKYTSFYLLKDDFVDYFDKFYVRKLGNLFKKITTTQNLTAFEN